MKKNIFISGLSLSTNNRGTQALGQGTISFLSEKESLSENVEIISPTVSKNPFRNWRKRVVKQTVEIDNLSYNIKYRMYWDFDVKLILFLYKYFKIYFPFTSFGKDLKSMQYTAAICGGDGFSDIYSEDTMMYHLKWVLISKEVNKPYLILPQTIGPFSNSESYEIARFVLGSAKKVYVRDTAFVTDLNRMGVNYVLCDDLSYYMKAKPFPIKVLPNSVGINISGLCYYNSFRNLAGRFGNYKMLLTNLIDFFQLHSIPVYLIPHSYNSYTPELDADDLEASKHFYSILDNRDQVVLVGEDLESPQIKYLISQMSFFVGSRMHSCFAAIYTETPVFGLGYSYKYEHNFLRYGLSENVASVLDLNEEDVAELTKKIIDTYKKSCVNVE
jgi:colanic acid/amylovoran biosynthesis protein